MSKKDLLEKIERLEERIYTYDADLSKKVDAIALKMGYKIVQEDYIKTRYSVYGLHHKEVSQRPVLVKITKSKK